MEDDAILITGGAGFLGRHLARHYAELGWNVTVLDDLSCQNSNFETPVLQHRRIRKVLASTRDRHLIERLVAENAVVVHFASVVGVAETMTHAIETIQNLEGTLVVAGALTPDHVALFGSSADVYGLHSRMYNRPMAEDDDVIFEHAGVHRWVYAKVKALEEIVFAESACRTIVVRLFNAYGPEMDYPLAKRVVPQFIDNILRGEPMRIYTNGQQIRAFCYYQDTIAGLARCISYTKTLPAGGSETFNIGSQETVSIRELADLINATAIEVGLLERPVPVLVEQADFYDQPFDDLWDRVPDLTKAARLLDFAPKVRLPQGLRQMLLFYAGLRGGLSRNAFAACDHAESVPEN